MKKFVRVMSAAMSAALVLTAMAGCGGSKDSGGSSDGKIKIGGIGPITGAAAIYGQAVKNAAEIAVEEINAKGEDVQFELQFEDDENDAEKSVNAYNKLKDWGMQILMGTVTTKPCIAVSTETNSDKIFQLTPSASSTDVIGGQPDSDGNVTIQRKDNVFQMCFTDPNQGISAATYLSENLPDATVAVIYNNGDAYSTGIAVAFVEQAAARGLEVVANTTFPDDTNADFTVQLGEAQKAGADLVFMPIYYQPASIILAQAKAMGYAPTFFGVDGMDGILTMEGFDPSLAEGLMLLTPFSATVPETQSFVEAYTAANDGVTPNQFAADAYDGVYIVKEALEKAGCTADMSSADICEALVAQMTQISYSGLTGKDMTWNAEGQVSKAPTAYVIKGGEYVLPEA